jgi:hypothetical protein
MIYLLKNEQIAAAETFDRAAALVARGWELTTKAIYTAQWQQQAAQRLEELTEAARCVPLQEREIGG